MSVYYSDDLVTLHHGDCLEITDWLEADVLVTDPPYGRRWRQGEVKLHAGAKGHARNAASLTGIANDDSTEARDAALALWGAARRAIIFGDLMLAPPPATKLVAVYAKPADAGLRGAMDGIRRDVEAIYHLGPMKSGIGGRSSVYRTRAATVGNPVGIVATSGGHPHAKPLDVLEELIGLTASGTVADPFAGSGSTLVAAKALGRKAIGVELDERYCEIAARRLSQGVLDLEGMGA
jgi:hypothetical protein